MKGIRIPEVLRKYIPGGQDFFPYPEEPTMGAGNPKANKEILGGQIDLPRR